MTVAENISSETCVGISFFLKLKFTFTGSENTNLPFKLRYVFDWEA